MMMVALSFSLSKAWGGPKYEVGYFYGSSVALEMGFGGQMINGCWLTELYARS